MSNKQATWSLCETVDGDADIWVCKIKTALGLQCDSEPGVITIKKIKITQPVMIVPLPSPDCATDWNYDLHGSDWVCNCNEGLEQSPIDLPFGQSLELLKFNAEFEYSNYSKSKLEMIWEINLLRIKIKEEFYKDEFFGKIKDLDGTVYVAKEILIHTPAEHSMAGHKYDMEI